MAKKRHYSSSRKYVDRGENEHMGRMKGKDAGYGVTHNEDSRMIHDDFSAPALLPRMVMDKDWPRADNYMNTGIEDLFMAANDQLREDASDLRRINRPKKY